MARKRFALVGVGARSRQFINALVEDHADTGELVALCDSNMPAMQVRVEAMGDFGKGIKLYHSDDFDAMIKDNNIEVVVVTTTDGTHDIYLCRAMELGCDTVTEKPLTTTIEKCQNIIDVQNKTGKECRVGFNYRYSAGSSHIKEILMSGIIGRIVSVNVIHGMGYDHGASYFHRWHGECQLWQSAGA